MKIDSSELSSQSNSLPGILPLLTVSTHLKSTQLNWSDSEIIPPEQRNNFQAGRLQISRDYMDLSRQMSP